jgi:hypothetical protein
MPHPLRPLDIAAAIFAIAGLLFMALAPQARADDAPQCRYALETVIPTLQADPSILHFTVIDKPDMVAEMTALLKAAGEDVPDNPTRILIAQVRDSDNNVTVKYGFEVGGCLAPPKPWPEMMPSPFPAAERMSGKTAAGTFA